jgi:hypothetical protein
MQASSTTTTEGHSFREHYMKEGTVLHGMIDVLLREEMPQPAQFVVRL